MHVRIHCNTTGYEVWMDGWNVQLTLVQPPKDHLKRRFVSEVSF